MCSDVVIRAEGLTKSYRVFNQSADRLKQAVTFGRRQYYKRFTALDNISFEIRKGETVGIVGRNGSGKSTLLQLVCGILKPSSGRVQVNGRISALLELGAGFHPDFTGRENVLFYATVLGMPCEQIERRLPEIEAFADIGEFMDQPVRTYSSGMFVRLAFATAIHTDPDILVVDEALAVGDAAFQAKSYDKVREIQGQGCTVLLVSHDLNLIARSCDRVFLLDHGRLGADNRPPAVFAEYRRILATGFAPLDDGKDAPTPDEPDHRGQPLPPVRWRGCFDLNKDETRFGDRRAEIVEAGIFLADGTPAPVVPRNEECLVRLRLLHRDGLADPVVSFSMTDAHGIQMCGTTSAMQNCRVEPMQEGSLTVYTFRQIMRLNPGRYLLNIGCHHLAGQSYLPYDVRHGYMSFQVIATAPRLGLFDPESRLEWQCEEPTPTGDHTQ